MRSLGVYIHIPFCIKKCNYCDFCSFPSRNGEYDSYTEELCRRIRTFANEYGKAQVDTVYFGGGTPTLLPTECFGRLMTQLNDSFCISADAEITAECNPATADTEKLSAMREMGINRLSIGLQSANENELSQLGRLHSFDDFCISFDCARRAGFDNVSIDLMYGIPEQTLESFENTLSRVIGLAPEHISAYGLKIEDGTVFGAKRDSLKLPDEDEEFYMYTTCRKLLEKHGYSRYEISNFAKPGRESRHNLRYWNLEDYVGFGVAAHSCIDGVRTGNSRDIEAFLHGEDIVSERNTVGEEERLYEYVMLGLRLREGISADKYFELSGRDMYKDMPMLEEFIRHGFIFRNNDRVAFTDKGFFVSNAILAELLN
ncbi:MAG: radical SAM family heme chaperone HemW [Clostridia bacterium]|nr:radical SAM family heme chaperone HemW [Clostridia bacterium]